MSTNRLNWWNPSRLQKDLPTLKARAKLRAKLADYFSSEDFLEVETPALQISPGLEPHIGAFITNLNAPGLAHAPVGVTRYLHTSPEFAMKKLLAGGLPRIWQLAPTFRNGEGSSTHEPQFTMLEWYRAAESDNPQMTDQASLIEAIFHDCQALLLAALSSQPQSCFRFRGKVATMEHGILKMTVAEAFLRYTKLDLMALIQGDKAEDEPDVEPIRHAAHALGLHTAADDRFEDIVFRIFGELIEPNLGYPEPIWLCDYPVSMAALARPKANDPNLAERFELYVCGLELANGFGELTDGAEQRRRFQRDQRLKQQLYGCHYPIDESFLEALATMPMAAGIALGFDRLLMLATHSDHIHRTLWAWVE